MFQTFCKDEIFIHEKMENFAEFSFADTNIYSFLRNLFLRIWAKCAKINSKFRKQFLPLR